MRPLLLSLLLIAAAPADTAVERALAAAMPGTRIGLVVTDETGREILAIRPDDRFVPASNTKIFTTAAAFALLDTTSADGGGGAGVRLEGGDVVLVGGGDARLSSKPDCVVDCLIDLARAVAATRTRVVRDVIGDDSAFADERWPAGMSWNNMATRSGTAVSALTVDDNVVTIAVRPTAAGGRGDVTGDGYYQIDGRVLVGGDTAALDVTRLPGSDVLRVSGTIPAAASPETLTVAVEDPAHRAAWRLAALLRSLGVRVTGRIGVRHRLPSAADDPLRRGNAPAARAPTAPLLARLAPPPLADDLRVTSKVSQNLHAELLLRRIGALSGTGSVADGRAGVTAVLDQAGMPRWTYDFADGSGMSSYNRVTPRSVVRLLHWTQAQRWGAAWRATLPVGGVDGTLARRFRGTPLEGKVFAKTGSLNAAAALSGFMVAASGRTLTFSALANDMPADASATAAIDAALLAVAAAN